MMWNVVMYYLLLTGTGHGCCFFHFWQYSIIRFFFSQCILSIKEPACKSRKKFNIFVSPILQPTIIRKYLKQTLGFMRNSTLWEKFTLLFKEIFTSADQRFISSGGLSTRQLFYEVLRFSWYFLIFYDLKSWVFWQFMRQLVYTSLLCFVSLEVKRKFT